MEEVGDKTKI